MNQRTQGSRLQAAGWASAFALLLSGCGSIPDLKPFADATQAVRSGVVSVGSEFASAIPADMRCSGSGPSAPLCRVKFSDAWKPRVDALGAIGDYSDGLAQVAAAGRDGAARAEQVVGSATTLLTTVGAVVPGAIASVATKGLAELAKARALRSMSEAIEAVHPPVKELFEALDADLATLDRTGQEIAVGTAALADADDKAQVGAAVARAGGAAGALRSVISNDHTALRVAVENLATVRAGKPVAGGCATEPDCVQQLQAIDRRLAENRRHLAVVEADLEGLRKAYAPTQAKKDAARTQAAQLRRTIVELRSALDSWLVVHRSLASDVRRGLQPNVRQLVATAEEIRKLLDDMRKAP